ncbi:hypothetical protein FK220_018345 [Flavobacteriaceae bacterium TP-CH-4]|uniref:Calcineurin-like phosphoesterase domain-containing protein n=1 Tax=Pelagihabitans pacificus TaxID=2696054 RepID=A0A967E857_9FLAO|nr:metallophosphoesterase [Pelagihabitans pacificus]NHF61320.1 hypothetical protein [Pelagihabitans pacificus]
MKILFLFIGLLCSAHLFGQTAEIRGMVFEDDNRNGEKDLGEKGISMVTVSDQWQTVQTDEEGAFVLSPSDNFPYVFISLPTGYTGTYYHLKAPELNFPLQRQNQQHFKFIHASDTHVDSLNLPRMQRFRQLADSVEANFIVVSGDLIRDALRVNEQVAGNYYQLYVEEIAKFKMPVYSGVGNHELFGIERDKSNVSKDHPLYGKKMFRKYLGPNYYSFNYGGIHFVSIDGVDYQDQYYFGGVDSLQLRWLEKDLEHLPLDTPIITFNHIPFVSPGFSFQDFENHEFYGPQLLVQKGRLAHRHIVHNFSKVQTIIGNRSYPLALAGHYHAAQESDFLGSSTRFAQTSAITRPDTFEYNGFRVRSGFTLYEVKDGKIISSQFIPLNFP